ncbi:MAG: 6-phosphofructokinase [Achromobacter sp.]
MQADDPGTVDPPPPATRYILRTSEGERVIALGDKRYRLKSGEVLTALAPQQAPPPR